MITIVSLKQIQDKNVVCLRMMALLLFAAANLLQDLQV
jgi:hypothetical protein